MIQAMARRARIPTPLEQVLIEAIRKSGLTQKELAARSGVAQPALSRFLKPDPDTRRTLTLPAADALCRALNLKLVKARKPRRR